MPGGAKGIITHDALLTTVGSARLTFTVGGGSVFGEVTAAPHPNFVSASGTTLVSYGGQQREFPGSIIDTQNKPSGGDGTQVTYRLRNRLWRWEEGKGTISGWYNRRKPNGDVIDDSEKTPRELAQLCLDALGEVGVDLTALPNDERPETVWDATRPLEALQAILRAGGCRHVYCPDDQVRVVRLGQGANLPTAGRMDPPDTGTDKIARPDKLELIGGRTLWELTFELEAVGLDTDDSIKLLDELSYRDPDNPLEDNLSLDEIPTTAVDPVNPTEQEKKTTKYANQTAGRWYRIKQIADGTLNVHQFPGSPDDDVAVADIKQFEFRNVLVDTKEDHEGAEKAVPAYVEGEYVDKLDANTKPGTRFDGGFSIDSKDRIVKLSQRAWYYDDDDPDNQKVSPAKLYLRTSCYIRDNGTYAPIRYSREKDLGRNLNTGTFPVRHDEVVRTIQVPYEVDGNGIYTADAPELNDQTIEGQADQFLNAHAAAYDVVLSEQGNYGGFLFINPDGAIRQLTWQLSDGVATSQASRNSEHEPTIPSFEMIRRKQNAEDERTKDEWKRYGQKNPGFLIAGDQGFVA